MSSRKNSASQAVLPLIDNRSLPKPLRVSLGDPCSISVNITGVPVPCVRWQIGRKRVKESAKYQLKTEGRFGHTLVIARVTEDLDQGVWVVASNEHGEDCCHIEVNTTSALDEIGVSGLRNQLPPIPNSSEIVKQNSTKVARRKKKSRRIGQTQSVISLDAWNSDERATIAGERPPSVDDVTSISGDAGMTTPPILNQSLDSGAIRSGSRKKRSQAKPSTRFGSTGAIYSSSLQSPQDSSTRDPAVVPTQVPPIDTPDRPAIVIDPPGAATPDTGSIRKKRSLRKKTSGSKSSLASAGGELPKEDTQMVVVNDAEVVAEPKSQTETEKVARKTRKKSNAEEIPTTPVVVAQEGHPTKEEGRVIWELFGIKLNLLCQQLLLSGIESNTDFESSKKPVFQEAGDQRILDPLQVSASPDSEIAVGIVKNSKEHIPQHMPVTNVDYLAEDCQQNPAENDRKDGTDFPDGSNETSVEIIANALFTDKNQQLVRKGGLEVKKDLIKPTSNNNTEFEDTSVPIEQHGTLANPDDVTTTSKPCVTVTPETTAMVKITDARPIIINKNLETMEWIDKNQNKSKQVESEPEVKSAHDKVSADGTTKPTDKPPSGKRKTLLPADEDHNKTQQDTKESPPPMSSMVKLAIPTKDASDKISTATEAVASKGSKNTDAEDERKVFTTPSTTNSHTNTFSQPPENTGKTITQSGIIANLPQLLTSKKPVETNTLKAEPIKPVQVKTEDQRQISNIHNKNDLKIVELESTNSVAKTVAAAQTNDEDLKTRTDPEYKPDTKLPVTLTTYITHRSRKLQTDLENRPAANITSRDGNTEKNSIAPTIASTTTTATSKPPLAAVVSEQHHSASLPPPSPAPRSPKRVYETPENSNKGEIVNTGTTRQRSRSAERPPLVLVDIDIDGNERLQTRSPPTPKERTSLRKGISNLHRYGSGDLNIRGGSQTDLSNSFFESSDRPEPRPRHRISLKPAKSEEFLAGKSDSANKLVLLQRGFLRGSKSVESLASASDSSSSRMGRRTLSKEWQVVTVTTTEEIVVIDQSKIKKDTVKEKEEKTNEATITDSKTGNEKDGKPMKNEVTDTQTELEKTPKLTVKELRNRFLGLNDEEKAEKGNLKPNKQEPSTKLATETLKAEPKEKTFDQVDNTTKNPSKDTQINISELNTSNQAPSKDVDSTNKDSEGTEKGKNTTFESPTQEIMPSREPENVTYVSNAIIFLKSPTTRKEDVEKSTSHLEVTNSRQRLNSQDMCTQTDADDTPKETNTTTSTAVQVGNETPERSKTSNGTENVCSAVFYEYSEMLSYYLDPGDENQIETQDSETEHVKLQINEPITATVTETFDRIILAPQSYHSSEDIGTDNIFSDFTDQTTGSRDSNSMFTDTTEVKPMAILSPRERAMIEQMFQDNDPPSLTEPNLIAFDNEPWVRSINNRVSEDISSLSNRNIDNRIIATETDVDEILIDTHHSEKSKSIADDTNGRLHDYKLNKPVEEISHTTQTDAASKDDDDASDEESHQSSVSSVPSCNTVIFRPATDKSASTSDTKINQDDASKPTQNLPTRRRSDDTDEDEVLELELDSTLRTDETDGVDRRHQKNDDTGRVYRGDDEALLGAVGGVPPQRTDTKSNQDNRSKHDQDKDTLPSDRRNAERTYEDMEEKVYMHSALSRLGTVLFLLLAAIIFHFLNRIVGDELE